MEAKPDACRLGLKANLAYLLRGVLSGLGAFSTLMSLLSVVGENLPLGLIVVLIKLVITCAIYPGRYRIYAQKHRNRLANLDAHIETVNSTVSQPIQGLRTPSKQHGPAQRSWFDKVATVTRLSILGMALLCLVLVLVMFLAPTVGLPGGNEKAFRQYNTTGVRHSRDGRYDEAVIAFTNATQVDAFRPRSYLNRAVVYLKQGKWSEAVRDCGKVIDLMEHGGVDSDVELEQVYYIRGVANHKSGNSEQAIKDWTRVMRLNPVAVKATRLVRGLGRAGQEAPGLSVAVSSRQSIANKARVSRSRSQSHTPRGSDLNRQAPPTTERFEVHGEHMTFEVPDGFSRLEIGSVEFEHFRKMTPSNVELLRVFIEDNDQSRLRQGKRMLGHRTVSIKTMVAPPIENYTLKHFDLFAAVIRDAGPDSILAAGGVTMSHGVNRHPRVNGQEEVLHFDTVRYRNDCFLVTSVVKSAHSRETTPSATWRSSAFAFCLRKGKIMEIKVMKKSQRHSRTDLEWATRNVKRYIDNLG